MDSRVAGRDIPSLEVVAQWALQGKQSHDAGVRLLSSSRAVVNEENFSHLLERYSLGTLEQLPQVAVTWFEDKAASHGQHAKQRPTSYVGVAIHAQPPNPIVDVGGRDVVQTSYFCVEYDVLARSPVSYSAMYEAFGKIQLPIQHRECVKTTLPVHQPRTPDRQLAIFVAALLLTNKPVCVLGADDVNIDERLRFIDDVAALLPYGMRSRLSAATWTSSTNRTHNFRLFFSSKERSTDDHRVPWHAAGWPKSTGRLVPDRYVAWLASDVDARVKTLAAMTRQMGFTRDDVMPTLTSMGVLAGHRYLPSGGGVRPAPADPPEPETLPADAPTVESLLVACATDIKNANPTSAAVYIKRLNDYAWDDLSAEERERCREIMITHRLLREKLGLSAAARSGLYQALLRLIFNVPIVYATYISIEKCVDEDDDWPVHPALGEAIGIAGASLTVQVLARRTVTEMTPKMLADMLAQASLQEHHAQFIFDVGLVYLEERAGNFQPEDFRAAFQPRGYLAEMLHRLYFNDPEREFSRLVRVLQLIYGQTFGQAAVDDILAQLQVSGTDPSAALCAAIFVFADREVDIGHVIRSACEAFIRERRFGEEDERIIMTRLEQVMPMTVSSSGPGRPIRRLLAWCSHNGAKLVGIVVAVGIVVVLLLLHR